MQNEIKTIFLSHAHKDKTLADKLVDLLTNGCGVNPNNVLCTSLEGKGIPAGTSNFIEYLREQIREPKLVILLLSENYFASHFCLCELGAVWGMGLSCFPLVVPPTDKNKLKATLAVTQAGDVSSKGYLDELRDAVQEKVGCGVPTATWNVKRDAFLNGLDDVIESLPAPISVPPEKLKDAQNNYQAALEDIGKKEKQIETMKAQVADLEKCKDKEQVGTVARKYSTENEVFEELCTKAQSALSKLQVATRVAMFWTTRGDNYIPKDQYEWDQVRVAAAVDEVCPEEDCCYLNEDHPRVSKALDALSELREFVDDLEDAESESEFERRFEEENDFPLSLSNKDFWNEFLGGV